MNIALISSLTICILIVSCAGELHSVIICPGYGGSQLQASTCPKLLTDNNFCLTKYHNRTIWLDEITLQELAMPTTYLTGDCWVNAIRLVYNNSTRKTSDAPGVRVSAEFGKCSRVESLHDNDTLFNIIDESPLRFILKYYETFHDMVEGLVNIGLVRDESIRGAAYDFRRALNEHEEYLRKLKALIEELYNTRANTPVILIGHSMGCPLLLHFLHQQTQGWKDKYIRALVGVAGNWGGCTLPIKMFTEGSDLNIPLLSAPTLRKVLVTFPATTWNMPRTALWNDDEVLVSTCNKNYTLSNLKEFFYDLDLPEAWERYKDTYKYTTNMDPPGVEVHCLHGYGLDTLESIRYSGTLAHQGAVKYKYGDGDGTINRRSLDVCKNWSSAQKQKVFVKEFLGISHSDIIKEGAVIDYISSLSRGSV